MKKTIKIQVYCYTGFTGCNHNYIEEIDKDEWDSMSKKDQNSLLHSLAEFNMSNHIDYGAYVLDDEDDN